jgi:NAD(P)-dependent dehydrogenase (short-subunit alcohol dehydrogenase family)
VTGASGAIVEELLEGGLAVVPGVSGAAAAARVRERFGERVEEALVLDLAQPLSAATFGQVEQRGIDVLVNDAGVTADGLMVRLDRDAFDRVLRRELLRRDGARPRGAAPDAGCPLGPDFSARR